MKKIFAIALALMMALGAFGFVVLVWRKGLPPVELEGDELPEVSGR